MVEATQHEVLDGVEPDRTQAQGVLDGGADVVEPKVLEQPRARSTPPHTRCAAPLHRAPLDTSLLCSTKHPWNARWTTHAVWFSAALRPRHPAALWSSVAPPFSPDHELRERVGIFCSGRRAPGGGSRLSTGAEAGTRAPSSASLPRAVVPDGRGVVRASWLTDLGALWGLGLRRPRRALISRKGGAGKTPRHRQPDVRTNVLGHRPPA